MSDDRSAVEKLADKLEYSAEAEPHGGELWSSTARGLRSAIQADRAAGALNPAEARDLATAYQSGVRILEAEVERLRRAYVCAPLGGCVADANRRNIARAEEAEAEIERLLEAIRLTQEYIQLPPIEGWSWWDAYREHRPEDAQRLRREWLRAQAPPEGDR